MNDSWLSSFDKSSSFDVIIPTKWVNEQGTVLLVINYRSDLNPPGMLVASLWQQITANTYLKNTIHHLKSNDFHKLIMNGSLGALRCHEQNFRSESL